MAGTIIDMSTIKQMLQLSQDGVSNRQIARQLGISRDKVNEFVNAAHKDSLGINGLLKLEDPILERRFHSGNPAYTDDRMLIISHQMCQSYHSQMYRVYHSQMSQAYHPQMYHNKGM